MERDGRRAHRVAAGRRGPDARTTTWTSSRARCRARNGAISKNFAPPAFTLITPNPVNDGSSYRVFAFPTESLNDADRTVVTNPADSDRLAVRLA